MGGIVAFSTPLPQDLSSEWVLTAVLLSGSLLSTSLFSFRPSLFPFLEFRLGL